MQMDHLRQVPVFLKFCIRLLVHQKCSEEKFPENVRAVRLVVEELLRSTINCKDVGSMEDLLANLEDAARKSKTSKMWVNCFIKPVFLMML